MTGKLIKVGDRIACLSRAVKCCNHAEFSWKSRAEWNSAWPTGIVLGHKEGGKFYYVLASDELIYEFDRQECWYLEKVSLNYDELLTHSNEIVRVLTKKAIEEQ